MRVHVLCLCLVPMCVYQTLKPNLCLLTSCFDCHLCVQHFMLRCWKRRCSPPARSQPLPSARFTPACWRASALVRMAMPLRMGRPRRKTACLPEQWDRLEGWYFPNPKGGKRGEERRPLGFFQLATFPPLDPLIDKV